MENSFNNKREALDQWNYCAMGVITNLVLMVTIFVSFLVSLSSNF